MAGLERLYYADSYTTQFRARVVERLAHEGRPALVLDGTYFYPTGGGQPHDTGSINGVAVVNAVTRESDRAVLHVLAADVSADEVDCHIDWARRFDHMQHHTGQHILTQAFVQAAEAHTVGFHLSPDSVTIDLDQVGIAADTVFDVEELANRIVFENRPVTARWMDANDAQGVRARRLPGHVQTEGLRVVEVADFDLTACGGTHVARTGEIGIIKVLKLEKRGDKTRVEFRCGRRALRDYAVKNSVANQLAADLTCRAEEAPQAVARMRDELKEAQRALKAAGSQLIEYESARLLSDAGEAGGVRIVKAAFAARDAGEVRTLANRLVQSPRVVALLGTSGERAQIFLARSGDLDYDMNALLRDALPLLGEARGGGQSGFAQGGGVLADAGQVQQALDEAERRLLE